MFGSTVNTLLVFETTDLDKTQVFGVVGSQGNAMEARHNHPEDSTWNQIQGESL